MSAIRKAVFAGGGTAGHIEPALAVARELLKENPTAELLFLGTSSGLEVTLIPEAGFSLHLITRVRIPRSLSPALLKVPFTFLSALKDCMSALKGADVLVGFGGYVSGPAYLAARIRRVPFVIHEANARPGFANRIGAYFTQYSAISYPVQRGKLSSALLSGLPVRQTIAEAYENAAQNWEESRIAAKRDLGFDEKLPLICVLGGSQGSVALNSVIAQSLSTLNIQEIQVLHGVGAKNALPESTQHYKAHHYITEIPAALLAADLIISRSGAVTCAEFAVLGRYALFIPLPIGNGEQALNAVTLVENNRAEICSQDAFTPEWLSSNLNRLLVCASNSPLEGNSEGLLAAHKIVQLMNYAVAGGK